MRAVLESVQGISMTRFGYRDVVRHPLVGRIVDAYDKASDIEFEDSTANCPIASDQVVHWAKVTLSSETDKICELAIRVVDATEATT